MSYSKWVVKKVVKTEGYNVIFRVLMEDMTDQMSDTIRPSYEATTYNIQFRDTHENDAATPVLSINTTKEYGNVIYRRLMRETSRVRVRHFIGQLGAAIRLAGSNFCQLYPGKFSGYFDGDLKGQTVPVRAWEFIENSPVLAAQI